MNKVNEDIINQINSYPNETTNKQIGLDLGLHRDTVAKYRDKTKEELARALSKEEQEKLDLLKTYNPKELKELLYRLQTNTNTKLAETLGEEGHLKFGLLSDTHYGAKQCARDEIGEFYDKAMDRGVEAFIHCGDLLDGSGVYQGQQFEQNRVGLDEQLADVEENYPRVKVPTYFIGGNHDEVFLKQNGVNPLKQIENIRKDLHSLGFYDARITLNGIEINPHHGGGSLSYAESYKLNRYLDKINPKDLPDVFALGHYHAALHTERQGISAFLPGAFLKENLLAKRFNLANTIGGWVIEIDKDGKGDKHINTEFIGF